LIPATSYQAALPGQDYSRVNPKLSAAYMAGAARLHGSFGMGIRPPGGSELAFTNNPRLKPERSTSFDVGVEQRFLNNTLSFDATYFYNRYSDLIVSLGGNLAVLSSFQTDNLARAKSKGLEFSGQFRPVRWISVGGNYTHLDTSILSLAGSSGLVQKYYTVGQELPRRPANFGSLVSTFSYWRFTVNVLGSLRGRMLDIEPRNGVSGGFFQNKGFENIGVNVNFDAGHGVTLYGNLRNALNQRYEEIYGYPAPILNFVAGVKWSLQRSGK
jgi:outer membrane receptor protein involved in Fe transport